MSITRRRKLIGAADNAVAMTVLTDKKLKTNSFIVRFISELTEENAAKNAAVAFMLEDSCSQYPDITSFSRRLAQLYGANIRGGIGRFSDSSVITLTAGCIADKYALEGEEVSYEVLKLLLDCIFEPVRENGIFSEKDFKLKKQELIDDIDADINEKRVYALKNAGRIVYKGEPAGIAVKGERSAAEKLTCAETYAAYEKLLSSARVEISFVGCELPEKCEKLIEEKFTSIKRENVYIPMIVPSPAKDKPEEVTDRLDIVQSKMVMAYKTPVKNYPVQRVFNAVFGGTPFSLLFKNVREKLSLCYYCSTSFNAKKQVMYIDSGVESANIEAAQNEIRNQLAAAAKGDFPDELLEQSKLAIVCALKAVNDAPRAVADWYFNYCLDGEENTLTPEQFISLIENVTKQDVADFAASLIPDTVYVLTGKEA